MWGMTRIRKAVWGLRLALARGIFAAAHLVDPSVRWDLIGARVIREAEAEWEENDERNRKIRRMLDKHAASEQKGEADD